jgi:nicotinate-nucleotide--dimethylbenzimidazole phosphoribosyltransferase
MTHGTPESASNTTDDTAIRQAIQARLDDLTKPKGSLGKLEDYAEKLSVIQGLVPPQVRRKAVFVLAGDHGVVNQGVSLYPREVTAQMVHNFMGGGAGINVLAKACGFDVFAVDAGVDGDFPAWPVKGPARADGSRAPGFFPMKALRGTKDFAVQAAMNPVEFQTCLDNGAKLADFAASEGYDIVAIGDMGIGNTTSAAAILVALGFDPEQMIDRGTGIDDAMLALKHRVVVDAVKARGPFGTTDGTDKAADTGAGKAAGLSGTEEAMRIGAAFAGPEQATAAGLILGLRGKGIACMLDGFPVTAAGALAWRIDPSVLRFLFAGHQSRVKGHRPVLDAMGLEPAVCLEMRLGEGTGAVIGGFMVELGAKIAAEMATFSGMAISRATADEKDF